MTVDPETGEIVEDSQSQVSYDLAEDMTKEPEILAYDSHLKDDETSLFDQEDLAYAHEEIGAYDSLSALASSEDEMDMDEPVEVDFTPKPIFFINFQRLIYLHQISPKPVQREKLSPQKYQGA